MFVWFFSLYIHFTYSNKFLLLPPGQHPRNINLILIICISVPLLNHWYCNIYESKEMKAEGNDTWGSTCRTELKVKASADVGPPEGSWASGKVRVLFFWLWHELAPEKEELVKNLCGPQTSLFIKWGDQTVRSSSKLLQFYNTKSYYVFKFLILNTMNNWSKQLNVQTL